MINLVALPCLCVDVFDGTDELRAGGEALNFAVHASKFEEFNVSILGAVGQDSYAKFIMDSVSDKRIDVIGICTILELNTNCRQCCSVARSLLVS